MAPHCHAAPIASHGPGPGRIGHDRGQRSPQPHDIAWSNDPARFSGAIQFTHPRRQIAGHQRQPSRHRLDKGQPKGFAPTSTNKRNRYLPCEELRVTLRHVSVRCYCTITCSV